MLFIGTSLTTVPISTRNHTENHQEPIVFDTTSAAAYTLGTAAGTGTITFADGTTTAVDMTSTVANDQIINANLTLGTAIASNTTFSNASTTNLLTLAGGITGGSDGTAAAKTVTIAGAGATTISGIISNGGATSVSLNKAASSGLSILSGNNSYTGNTTINATGILRAGHNSALGTAGTVTITGITAVLELADGININRALTVSNAGAKKYLRLQDGATSGEYSGAIDIQETGAGDFETTVYAGGTLTYSGLIGASGGSNINKAGAGTLVVSGNNTLFDKGATVIAGVLRAGNNNAFGSTGIVTLANTDATLELANGITINRGLTVNDTGNNKTIRLQDTATSGEYSGAITISELTAANFDLSASTDGTLTLSGAIGASAGANINKEGAGTVVLSGDNSLFDKNVTINVGVLRAGHNNAFGNTGIITLANTGATLELANGITINRALTISNTGDKKTLALQAGATSAEYSGNITNSEESNATNFEASVGSSGTLTLSGVVGGSGVVNTGFLTKTGVGTLVLSGTANNNPARGLVVDVTAGEVHLGKTLSSATVYAVFGIKGIANGATVKLTGTGDNQIYDGNADINSGVRGMVAGSTLNLNGNSETLTYLEGTGGTVDGGSGTPTLSIGFKGVSFAFGGVIQNSSGTLALTKTTAGAVTLSGENTYSGATTVTGGVLRLDHANALPGGTGTTGGTSALIVSGGVIGLGAGDFTRALGTTSEQVSFAGSINGFAAYGADRIVNLGGASATVSLNSANFFTVSNATLILGRADATHTVDFQNPLILVGTGTKTFASDDGAAAVDGILSGAISGTGHFSKTGGGTLAVTGPISYSGNTTVNAGTLTLSNAATPANANPNNDASTLTIAETGATLDLTYSGTDKVGSLVIGANPLATDTIYGKLGSPSPIVGIAQITGDGTITLGTPVTDPYAAWAGAGVNFDDDANNDGVDNGLAWLLGAGGPNDNATGLLPKSTSTGSGLKLTFKMLPEAGRGGAKLYLEYSSDLGTWSAGELVPDVDELTAPVTFDISGTVPLDVEATVSSSEAAAGKLFGRLRAER